MDVRHFLVCGVHHDGTPSCHDVVEARSETPVDGDAAATTAQIGVGLESPDRLVITSISPNAPSGAPEPGRYRLSFAASPR